MRCKTEDPTGTQDYAYSYAPKGTYGQSSPGNRLNTFPNIYAYVCEVIQVFAPKES